MKELIKKLANAKKEIGKISKDSENPFFKSKYFDINALLEHTESVLEKQGLMILQPIVANKVITEIYDIDTGECISSEMTLPNDMNPQKIGSAITYYRRYTLQSLLALQAKEDDDGNKASVENEPNKKESDKTEDDKKWLNTYTKKGGDIFTEEFKECHKSIHEGATNKKGEFKKYTIKDIRLKYAVNKEVVKDLENEFILSNDLPFN